MIRIVLLIVLSGMVSGCAQKLANYDYNPQASYSQLKTYRIQKDAESSDYQSLDDARIEAAIVSAMAGRYQQQAEADFVVTYGLKAERKVDRSGVSFGFGVVSSSVGVGVNTTPEGKEITEGRLLLNIISRDTDQVVWTASANKYLRDSMAPDERSVLIQQLVTEMLGNFPP